MPLAKLTKIDLREEWKHEANDFTKWLALDENLRLLGDEIGYELVVLGTEAPCGKFNLDILCEETGTKNKIVIENQLETTDHDHLGKLITYASGHSARVAIWVVSDVREEHRKAIDWLNEHTDEQVEFYLVKIELWQIADSPYAPKFEVICKPNGWARTIREASAQPNGISETKLEQLDFWTQFSAYVQKQKLTIRPQKASPQHWINISIGSSGAYVCLTLNSQKELMGCELYINDNKALFSKLEELSEEIEADLKESPEWRELPGKKASRIRVSAPACLEKRSEWIHYFEWLSTEAERFRLVFPKYLKTAAAVTAVGGSDVPTDPLGNEVMY